MCELCRSVNSGTASCVETLMLSLCVPVPICVRLFKENSIKRSQCLLIKKKINMKKRSIAFLERKKKKVMK